jgi:hypothetical protein
MSSRHKNLVLLLSIGLVLSGLLGIIGSIDVAAQDGGETLATLKAQAWGKMGLIALPVLSAADDGPPDNPFQATSTAEAYWKRIAFQSYRDGNWEIYWMDRFGGDQRRITNHRESDIRPRLSLDLNKIVFSSKRDGDWGIYIINTNDMNLRRITHRSEDEIEPSISPDGKLVIFSRIEGIRARIYQINSDGTGETALTSPPDGMFDISPAWSPDGTKIAWVRIVDGRNGDIMIMDRDGRNQLTIARNLRYPQNISWSPDGQLIALDCDLNFNDLNDLYVINLRGYTVYTFLAEFEREYWLGSWSPDGKELIFTNIRYIVRDNRLYVAEARLARMVIETRRQIALPGSGLDMAPDWQRGIDNQSPAATIQPLPALSPAPIAIRWSGTDSGPAGVASYDVQVRENEGPWTDWLRETVHTGDAYWGQGGRRYAFRVRARDDAGNVSNWTDERAAQTTVESLPPRVAFTEAPAFLRDGSRIAWEGDDPGGSGIMDYDVQYRVSDSSTWTPWKENSPDKWDYFYGEPGQSYVFRVRARDRANNRSAWHETTHPTTVYAWGITGSIYDNRRRPLEGAVIRSAPPGQYGGMSNATGAYYLYGIQRLDFYDFYTVDWYKEGYGSPPSTAYPAYANIHTDVVLPPPDNAILNPSFEDSGARAIWQAGGVYPPHWQTHTVHTGAQAVRLGLLPYETAPLSIPGVHQGESIKLSVDDRGNKHLIWYERNDTGSEMSFYYVRIGADGSLSPVKRFGPQARGQVVVGRDGTVHAVWNDPLTAYQYLFYAVGSPDGRWYQQKLEPRANEFRMAVDASGVLHIVYLSTGQYQQRTPDGRWSPLEKLSLSLEVVSNFQNMVVTPNGTVYLFFKIYYTGWFYFVRRPDGRWEEERKLPDLGDEHTIIVRTDNKNNVHFLGKRQASLLIYTKLTPDHTFSQNKIFNVASYYDLLIKSNNLVSIIIFNYRYLIVMHEIENNDFREEVIEVSKYLPRHLSISGIISTFDKNDHIYGIFINDKEISIANITNGIWSHWQKRQIICALNLVIDANNMPAIAWLGGRRCQPYFAGLTVRQSGHSRLQQTVTVPTTLNAPTLSFFYRFSSLSPSPSPLRLIVNEGQQSTTVFTTTTTTEDWKQAWVDLSPWAGRQVTLSFEMAQIAGGISSWAELDDVTLGSAAYPDLWAVTPAVTPAPGETFRLQLFYGNSGDGIGYTSQLTLTLPLTLTSVTVEPPPSTGPAESIWRWDVGDLAPQGSPGAVTITATVPLTLTSGTVLTGTWHIDGIAAELNRRNNTGALVVWVGGSTLYWPRHIRSATQRVTGP